MGKKRRKQKNMQAKMQQNQVSSKGKKFENGNAKEVAFALENYDNEESSEINNIEKPKQAIRLHARKTEQFNAPVGLSNLGNTCFFNSIVQNLFQTHLLHKLIKDETTTENEFTVDPNDGTTPSLTYVPVGHGELSTSLSDFFDSVKSMQQSPNEVISNKKAIRSKVFSPRSLFSQVCSKNQRFRGYQQQDSQELYHCLLDGIKNEEIKRKKRGILKALNLNKPTSEEIPEEVRQRVKAYGRVVSEKEDTIVEKVFGGTLVSSVLCDSCHTVTGVVEPFHDISLPIVEEKISKPANRNKKQNQSDESDRDSIPEKNNIDNKKQLSKYATKKARKAAEKEAKRSRRKGKRVAERAASIEDDIDPVERLADSLAEETLSLAMLSLCGSVNGQSESEKDEQCTDSPKLKGGAVSVANLNLPLDEAAHESVSKVEMGTEESEKLKGPKSDELEQLSDSENKELDKTDECVMEELENRVKNLTLDDPETNGADEIESGDSDAICGGLFDEEEESSRCPSPIPTSSLAMEESTLFDTPERQAPIFTSVQSCYDLPATLAPRELITRSSKDCTLESCFYHFTMPEMLTGSNKFGCEVCTKRQNGAGDAIKTVYCNASKQILIKSPPAVLTIHLKRFQQVRCSLRKVNRHVNFPTILDIAPYCAQECEKYADEDMKIVYGLYGMVEHSGSLSRGHYTAYVRSRNPEDPDPDSGQWFHISDTIVTKVSAAKALKCNAYLIFYERLNRAPPR